MYWILFSSFANVGSLWDWTWNFLWNLGRRRRRTFRWHTLGRGKQQLHDATILGDEYQAHRVDTPKDPATGTNLCGAQRNQTYKPLPHQRNPLFSVAENSCLWELNRLSRHYHPSVCLFTRTLMKVSFGLAIFYYTKHDGANFMSSCTISPSPVICLSPSESVRVRPSPYLS